MYNFKLEIEKFTKKLTDNEWSEFSAQCKIKYATKRKIIFRQTEVCKEILYITDGILASEYFNEDKLVITRFFKSGNFCTNILSAASYSLHSDNIVAITDVVFIIIPVKIFIDLYLYSDTIGVFFRKKILENTIENKNFITIKTISDTEIKYQFLENNYPEVIKNIPSKYVAAFLGITAEALSRFLNKRYKT